MIDQALSPRVADCLSEAGHDAVHVVNYQMAAAKDSEILQRAEMENRIIISADTDFGTLLALRQKKQPSFVLLRGGPRQPKRQAELLVMNLPPLEEELLSGCIVVFHGNRIRVRSLPVFVSEK